MAAKMYLSEHADQAISASVEKQAFYDNLTTPSPSFVSKSKK